MNKETLQGILKMIESASRDQLNEFRTRLVEEYEKAVSEEGKRDLQYAMKLVDEESISRLLIQRYKQD